MTAGLVLAGCSQGSTGNGTTTTTTTSGPGSPGTNVPVTTAQMKAVVAATVISNNKANESLDLALLKSYEAGSALAIDAASYAEAKAVPDSTCSYPPFGIKFLQAVALTGSAYPQRFVVLGSTYPLPPPKGCTVAAATCSHADSIFEYARTAATAPWKITLEPSADSGDIVQFAGSRSALGPADASAARELPGVVATDLEHYESTGSRGPLKATYFNGTCWLIPDPRAAFEQYGKSGVSAKQVYSPASDDVSVPIAGGNALTMFTLDFETTLVPKAGTTIDWPAGEALSALLPSGQYKLVVEHGALQIAAETGSGGQFTVVGAYDGFTSITGTLGSPGPGSTTSGGVLVSYVAP